MACSNCLWLQLNIRKIASANMCIILPEYNGLNEVNLANERWKAFSWFTKILQIDVGISNLFLASTANWWGEVFNGISLKEFSLSVMEKGLENKTAPLEMMPWVSGTPYSTSLCRLYWPCLYFGMKKCTPPRYSRSNTVPNRGVSPIKTLKL